MIVPRFLTQSPQRLRMIVALAMFEACSIFGLVTVVLYKDWRLFVAPWVLSLIGFVREWPRDEVNARAS
jgi:hypothetical protein